MDLHPSFQSHVVDGVAQAGCCCQRASSPPTYGQAAVGTLAFIPFDCGADAFGAARAFHSSGAMLRITVRDSAERLRLELEGRLSGAWVAELEACWRNSVPILSGRELWVDLTGVHCVDAAGKYLLALMHESGARFIASGCMMAALVQEITGNWSVVSARSY